MITGIHHLTFLVRDLDASLGPWSALLDQTPRFDTLAERGVITARFLLGTTWLVLAQPVGSESIPARHLAKHGEGFFLLSFAVPDLVQGETDLALAGIAMQGSARRGVEGWPIQDINPSLFSGVQLQLCGI